MDFSLDKLKTARIAPEGQPPVPRETKRGVKWACLAAVSLIALAILVTCVASLLIVAGTQWGLPFGILSGVMQITSAGIIVFPLMYTGAFFAQSILNARYHLEKPKPVLHQYQQLQ